MLGGQSYIVRLLRKVEGWLNEHNHTAESTRVGKIVQRLAQADDIQEALASLYRVERLDQLALRLMWLLESAERGAIGVENGALDYQAELLGKIVLGSSSNSVLPVVKPGPLPDHVDGLYIAMHTFGRSIEKLKHASREVDSFQGIEEDQLYGVLSELASLKQGAVVADRENVSRFVDACSEFIQYVLEKDMLADERIVNVLDNANLTLQTVFEATGVEDSDSLESTIELLRRPTDLLN